MLKDTVKPIKNTWNSMMIASQANILHTLTQIVWMVGEWVRIFFTLNLRGISKNHLHGYMLKLDLKHPDKLHELHNNYSFAPKKWFKVVAVCCQIIVVILQINMA